MKATHLVALGALLVSTACGGPGGSLSAVPAKTNAPQTHVRHLQSEERSPLDVIGGAPSRFSLDTRLYDATLVGASAGSAFNAGIVGIDAVDANGDSWQLIAYSAPQVVNLLNLQANAQDLGSGLLPAGTYPSLQLLLDPNTTTVTNNGQTYQVRFTDSNHPWWDSNQSIEAVNIPLNVTGAQGELVATLDFNVFQSARLSPYGIAFVTPTVAGGLGSPTINGTVANAAGAPVSNATVVATASNGVVANTAPTAADGSFHIRAINPGAYTLTIVNQYTTNAGITVTASGNDPGAAPSVNVVAGANSQISLPAIRD